MMVDAVEDRVEYRIGRDEDDFFFPDGDESAMITVDTSGEITVATTNPDEDEQVIAVATGSGGIDNVAVLEIEIEADKEDVVIEDVYLALPATLGAGTTVNADNLEKVFDQFMLKLGNTTADSNDYMATKTFAADDYDNLASALTVSNVIEFEGVGETVDDGEDNAEKFDLTVDFNGIDKNDGIAGEYLKASKLIIVWEGDDSGTQNVTEYDIGSSDVTSAVVFPTILTLSTTEASPSLKLGKQKVYEFTVTADDEGEVYLNQVGFTIGLSGTTAIQDLNIYRGTDNSGTTRATMSGSVAAGDHNIMFTTPERIDAGSSRTYSVYVDATSTPDNGGVTVEMIADADTTAGINRNAAAARSAGTFVWSPDTLNERGDVTDTANTDWFTGWPVVVDSDTKQWSIQKD